MLARRGRHEEAEALAREAVALVAPTDALTDQGDALLALAEILELRGRTADAAAAAREAVARYRSKGATDHADRSAPNDESTEVTMPKSLFDSPLTVRGGKVTLTGVVDPDTAAAGKAAGVPVVVHWVIEQDGVVAHGQTDAAGTAFTRRGGARAVVESRSGARLRRDDRRPHGTRRHRDLRVGAGGRAGAGLSALPALYRSGTGALPPRSTLAP